MHHPNTVIVEGPPKGNIQAMDMKVKRKTVAHSAMASIAMVIVASGSTSAGQIGPKTQFVLDCYARVDKGDATVFKDCFAPDFKMSGPEMKLLSKDSDHALHGDAAVNAMGAMNRNDDAHFGIKKWTVVTSMGKRSCAACAGPARRRTAAMADSTTCRRA